MRVDVFALPDQVGGTNGCVVGDGRRVVTTEISGGLDAEGFVALYESAASTVYRFVARRLGADQADELTAEAFAQAWSGRHRYDPSRGDATGWLFGIVMNLMRRQRRSADRQMRAYARVTADPVLGDVSDVAAKAVDAQRELAAAARSLQRLSEIDRDVILLRSWAELSYEQIAEALGLSVGVVKTRLNRARNRLSAAMIEDRSAT